MEENQFKTSFPRIRETTKVVKLRDFQYRLCLGKIVTNSDLAEWNEKENDACTFCNNASERL